MAQSKLDRAASIVTLVVGFAILVRLATPLLPPILGGTGGTDEPSPPVPVEDWGQVLASGLRLSNPEGAVQIAVFTDLECPYCARFHLETLTRLASAYGENLGVIIVHRPLKSHRFAMQSAVALECAAGQMRAASFLSEVYSRQDSIGLRPWQTYAREAGVPDEGMFSACLSAGKAARVDVGVVLSDRLDVHSTPTIFVNGWRFIGIPSEDQLRPFIDSLLRPETTQSLGNR